MQFLYTFLTLVPITSILYSFGRYSLIYSPVSEQSNLKTAAVVFPKYEPVAWRGVGGAPAGNGDGTLSDWPALVLYLKEALLEPSGVVAGTDKQVT